MDNGVDKYHTTTITKILHNRYRKQYKTPTSMDSVASGGKSQSNLLARTLMVSNPYFLENCFKKNNLGVVFDGWVQIVWTSANIESQARWTLWMSCCWLFCWLTNSYIKSAAKESEKRVLAIPSSHVTLNSSLCGLDQKLEAFLQCLPISDSLWPNGSPAALLRNALFWAS